MEVTEQEEVDDIILIPSFILHILEMYWSLCVSAYVELQIMFSSFNQPKTKRANSLKFFLQINQGLRRNILYTQENNKKMAELKPFCS